MLIFVFLIIYFSIKDEKVLAVPEDPVPDPEPIDNTSNWSSVALGSQKIYGFTFNITSEPDMVNVTDVTLVDALGDVFTTTSTFNAPSTNVAIKNTGGSPMPLDPSKGVILPYTKTDTSITFKLNIDSTDNVSEDSGFPIDLGGDTGTLEGTYTISSGLLTVTMTGFTTV